MASRLSTLLSHILPQRDHLLSTALTDGETKKASPLDSERKKASFPVRQLTYHLDGGKEATKMKEMVAATIESDPTLVHPNKHDLTREQARENTMAKIKQVVTMIRMKGGADDDEKPASSAKPTAAAKEQGASRAGVNKTFEDAFYNMLGASDESWAIRMGVHYGLFQGAVFGQGSDEQRRRYERDIQEMRIIGCFCMTELGHGSYLQGLETTATYDVQTQEFIINSPTLTSTKWWIGMAGQTATHSVVYAQLIIKGVNHGVHSFIVPIRCTKTGQALPNITVGDCGAKMGRNGLDNGWVQYHNVRIPRDNMLNRWAQVAADGSFTKPPSKQMAYNALVGTRVELFSACSDVIKRAVTVAIRYGAVRRQFPAPAGPSTSTSTVALPLEEQQLLDYPTTQQRLFPILSWAYALHFSARFIAEKTNSLIANMSASDMDSLKEIHASSAGLKAFGTWFANDAIEVCRQSLGGHGYSSYAGLASMRANWAVMCTWEGDNTVMALQTGRFLLQQLAKTQAGETPSGFCMYLREAASEPARCVAASPSDLLRSDVQLAAYRHRSLFRLREAAQSIHDLMQAQGLSLAQAQQRCSVALLHCARVHCLFYLLQCFVESVRQAPEALRPVLKRLCDLFALFNMQETLVDFVEDGYLSGQQCRWLRAQVSALCLAVRPDAVSLVDAFNLPDFVLDSPLGRYDGDIYTHYFDMVKNAPGSMAVPSYWAEHIKPLVQPDD